MTSTLEATFDYLLRVLAPDLPEPVTEYRFHPTRRWRFDYCWPAPFMVAVELDGGAYSNGRHTRGAGYEADAEKLNTAVVLGWRVVRFTGGMLTNDPAACVAVVRDLLTQEAQS